MSTKAASTGERFCPSPVVTKSSWFTLPLPFYRCLLRLVHSPGQVSSVAQSWPNLCDPMACSTPGLPVHHQVSELTQTHVHRVDDAIQPSHPLSPASPPAFNLSQPSGSVLRGQFFTSGGQSIGVSASASVLTMNI